jgi:hypothetical protein
MNIIGDVSGRTCLIMDDMVDTAGTLTKAADALKAEGALKDVGAARSEIYGDEDMLDTGTAVEVANEDEGLDDGAHDALRRGPEGVGVNPALAEGAHDDELRVHGPDDFGEHLMESSHTHHRLTDEGLLQTFVDPEVLLQMGPSLFDEFVFELDVILAEGGIGEENSSGVGGPIVDHMGELDARTGIAQVSRKRQRTPAESGEINGNQDLFDSVHAIPERPFAPL